MAALLLLLELVPLTTSALKQREVPATVSSFYIFVLYTAMLRTSIAAVVLGCLYFCPLDCDASVMVVDCAVVETGCMLEKYVMSPLLLLSFASISVAAVEKGYAFKFFSRGAAPDAANHFFGKLTKSGIPGWFLNKIGYLFFRDGARLRNLPVVCGIFRVRLR